MNVVISLTIAVCIVCAAARTSEGQLARRATTRDSVLMLPRVTVESGIEVRWPDHAKLQRQRQATRDSLLGELAAARGRWRRLGADRVRYRITEQCFCLATWELPVYATVSASGDSVQSVVNQRGEPTALIYPLTGLPSIAFLFDRAEAAIRGAAELVIVTFDPVSGIPTRVFKDDQVGASDDELDIVVSHIEVVPER